MSIVKKSCRHALLGGAASVLFLAAMPMADAATIEVVGSDTYEVHGAQVNDPTNWVNIGYNDVVGLAGGAEHTLPIFRFQMPVLPVGEQVVSAQVRLGYVWGGWGNAVSADLDALTPTSSADRNASYSGATGYRVADDFVTGATDAWARVATTLAQSNGLGTWLSGQYVAGEYLNFRLDWHAEPSTSSTYYMGTHTFSASGVGGEPQLDFVPTLTLTTAPVPEPTMLGAMAVTGMLLLRRRSSQRA